MIRPTAAAVAIAGVVAMLAAATTVRRRHAADAAAPSDHAAAMTSYAARLDSLDAALARLTSAVDAAAAAPADDSAAGAAARVAFRAARERFKRVEMSSEYYAPWLARAINGPALTIADEDDPDTPLEPTGFQAVEPALFPRVDPSRLARAAALVRGLRLDVATLRRVGADTLAGDAYLFDAARQEIARVATLGVAGFDATLSGDAMAEAAAAIDGVRDALAPYRKRLAAHDPAAARALEARFDAAAAYPRAQPDFAPFDRLAFIAGYVQPLAHALADAQRSLGVGQPSRRRAWSHRAASIYDSGAVDPSFFAPLDAPRSTSALVALGQELFTDPALSPSGARSCATCHAPALAFTDGRARPPLIAVHGGGGPVRNTPTLMGAGLQPALFADERASVLEDQIADVLGSRAEMGGSLEGAASALRRRPEYRARFAGAFAIAADDSAVSARRLRFAVAAYLRTLGGVGGSRFDRAVRGDTAALTAAERRGFNLFMGRAACGTCHFAPLFNGATPPTLVEAEPEVVGVPARWPAGRRPALDSDPGRWGVRRTATNAHAFKTPTLRNVARTAPYMHNGALRTLADVIDFYDAGGGRGLGLRVPNQTLSDDSLHLTRAEKRDLEAFLRALDDTVATPTATR